VLRGRRKSWGRGASPLFDITPVSILEKRGGKIPEGGYAPLKYLFH